MDGDVFMCRVGVSVAQAASFAGGIDEFVRLSMEQAGSNMANRIRAAAEAARDAKGGG
jgi:ribosomal protein L18